MGSAKDKLASSVFPTFAEMMTAYSEEAVAAAWSDHRKRLDYSPGSIETLDAILSGQSVEDIEFQTRLWGGYFGEVIRRGFGGDWEMTLYPGSTNAVPTLSFPASGVHLYPLMKVYRRLTMGEAENLPAFYRTVRARLEGAARVN